MFARLKIPLVATALLCGCVAPKPSVGTADETAETQKQQPEFDPDKTLARFVRVCKAGFPDFAAVRSALRSEGYSLKSRRTMPDFTDTFGTWNAMFAEVYVNNEMGSVVDIRKTIEVQDNFDSVSTTRIRSCELVGWVNDADGFNVAVGEYLAQVEKPGTQVWSLMYSKHNSDDVIEETVETPYAQPMLKYRGQRPSICEGSADCYGLKPVQLKLEISKILFDDGVPDTGGVVIN